MGVAQAHTKSLCADTDFVVVRQVFWMLGQEAQHVDDALVGCSVYFVAVTPVTVTVTATTVVTLIGETGLA
jgi:hypothetical protein